MSIKRTERLEAVVVASRVYLDVLHQYLEREEDAGRHHLISPRVGNALQDLKVATEQAEEESSPV